MSNVEYVDLYSLYLREKHGLPDEWTWHSASSAPGDVPEGYMRFEGAVAPLGKRGARNWRKMDKSTERTFFVVRRDWEGWKAERERTTGICQDCGGHGKTLASFGIHGTTYRDCRHCSATGRAPLALVS
jgi:hypothetical protein